MNIHRAAYEGDLTSVRQFLKDSPSATSARDEDQRTALHWAVSGKRINVVADLLSGSSVNAVDDADWTPLHIAASVGSAPITDLLLQHGANVNAQNSTMQTPLFYAASKGFVDVINLLLAREDINLNVTDKLGQTALHRAASKGSTAIIKILLDQGRLSSKKLSLDQKDKEGNTALHLAVEMGNGDAAHALITAGADATIRNKEDKLALELGTDKHVREYLIRSLRELGRMEA